MTEKQAWEDRAKALKRANKYKNSDERDVCIMGYDCQNFHRIYKDGNMFCQACGFWDWKERKWFGGSHNVFMCRGIL